MMSVLQFVIDPEMALRECHRVLKSRGQLVLSVPNLRAAWRVWRLMILGVVPRTSQDTVGLDGGTLHYFTTKTLRSLLTSAGFSTQLTQGIFYRPTLLDRVRPIEPFAFLTREFCSGEILIEATS